MKNSLKRTIAISLISSVIFLPSLSHGSARSASSSIDDQEIRTHYAADKPAITTRLDSKQGSLLVNRLLDALETAEKRSALVKAIRIEKSTKLDYRVDGYGSSPSEASENVTIFRNNSSVFDKERNRFVKAFFEKTISSLWITFYQSVSQSYESRLWSWLRPEDIEDSLNKTLLAQIQKYETTLNNGEHPKAGQLPDDFQVGDLDYLKHLDMTINGDKASEKSKVAHESRYIELAAFQAIFGDLLSDDSTIVDPNQFGERAPQIAHLMAIMKAEFMDFIMDRDGYVREAQEKTNELKELQKAFVESNVFSIKDRSEKIDLFAYLPEDMKAKI